MRILWITNILFPEAKEKISERSRSVGGGWMIGAGAGRIGLKRIQNRLYVLIFTLMLNDCAG